MLLGLGPHRAPPPVTTELKLAASRISRQILGLSFVDGTVVRNICASCPPTGHLHSLALRKIAARLRNVALRWRSRIICPNVTLISQ